MSNRNLFLKVLEALGSKTEVVGLGVCGEHA